MQSEQTNSTACCKHVTCVDTTTYQQAADFCAITDDPVERVETVLFTGETQF